MGVGGAGLGERAGQGDRAVLVDSRGAGRQLNIRRPGAVDDDGRAAGALGAVLVGDRDRDGVAARRGRGAVLVRDAGEGQDPCGQADGSLG